ncbi:E3 ubiquitin-protein ligase MARCH5 [Eumeta japonica]|uniref:E3 ubiquitin-protein ligase MARCH5 n=1 Tax=Eumeta variegata TaxID=151549 RepID=A0A4C1Z2I7_EUMVA|nr:E3 ubiquitin-protein ligase MARCH5 [Eumeta japonica]
MKKINRRLVVGHREGLEMMESADPLVLLVLLPTIPVTLISAKMYNWEDSVLFLLRKYCAKIPALGYILPFGNLRPNPATNSRHLVSVTSERRRRQTTSRAGTERESDTKQPPVPDEDLLFSSTPSNDIHHNRKDILPKHTK